MNTSPPSVNVISNSNGLLALILVLVFPDKSNPVAKRFLIASGISAQPAAPF